jgi:DNA-binding XRE family transcriptional regulator
MNSEGVKRGLRHKRESIVRKMGAKCVKCGYDKDVRALQIDHIDSDGKADRAKFKNSTHYYYSIFINPDATKYQILCVNCNRIKMHTDSEWQPPDKTPMPKEIMGELRNLVIQNQKKRTSSKRKLTDDQADEILERFRCGETQTALGKEFGISQTAISAMILGKFYKYSSQKDLTISQYKQCSSCKKVYLKESAFTKDTSRKDGYYSNCRECHGKLTFKNGSRFAREHAIQLLGGKCVECGYNKDVRALEIDHVHSDGYQERDNRKVHLRSYYKNILANIDSGNYQCLCANCNALKRHTHGEWNLEFEPMPEEITGELRDAVIAAKAPAQGRFLKGVSAINRKISSELAKEIKERLKLGELGSKLAKEYGVSQSTISHIKLDRNNTY